MALRRGFKAEAERTAREVRAELGLAPVDPLDPGRLATHLEIPVQPLAFVEDEVPAAVWHLRRLEPGTVSALTIVSGTGWLILHNDGHSPARQASDIMHELSHALLLHPAAPPWTSWGVADGTPGSSRRPPGSAAHSLSPSQRPSASHGNASLSALRLECMG